MTALTGLNMTNLPSDILFGEGVVFVGSTKIGVTRGAPKWTPGRTFDNLGFDGKHAPIKGIDRVLHGETTVAFTMLEIGQAATGGQLARVEPDAVSTNLDAPFTPTLTGSSAGGTLAAATYYVRATAVVGGVEGPASGETSVATSGSTSSISCTVSPVAGATAYRFYIGTTTMAQTGYFAVASGSLPLVITTLVGITVASIPVSAGTTYYPAASGSLVATYQTDVRLIWERGAANSGNYFAIYFPFGLVTKYDIAGQDKKEALIAVEIAGRIDGTGSITAAPYRLEYRTTLP